MAQLLNGSMCLTDIVELAKKGHSAFARGQNGKVYFNFTMWINDEPDQFKNHASLKLNSTKEKRDAEKAANNGKDYFIGNARKVEGIGEPLPANANSTEFDIGGANIRSTEKKQENGAAEVVAPIDNLPF